MSTRLDTDTASLRRDVSSEDATGQSPQRALESASPVGHTPGPWIAHACGKCGQIWADGDGDGPLIGKANIHAADGGYADPLPREVWEANQRLMAAAPELLAALNALADDYAALMGDGMTEQTQPKVLADARAALAKAQERL